MYENQNPYILLKMGIKKTEANQYGGSFMKLSALIVFN